VTMWIFGVALLVVIPYGFKRFRRPKLYELSRERKVILLSMNEVRTRPYRRICIKGISSGDKGVD